MSDEDLITPKSAIEALQALGWTYENIADGSSLSQPTISRIAKGSDPSWGNGQRIIRLLKIFVGDVA